MRALLLATAAAMALYGGYWAVGSRAALAGAETTLQAIRDRGLGDFGAVRVAGFPSRFDLTIEAPRLASADGLSGWSAPFVQVLALSYRPNRVIVVWPHEQVLRLGGEALSLSTADMRASAAFTAGAALALDHAALVATSGALASGTGWSLGFAEARLASRLPAGTGTAADGLSHEVGLVLSGLSLAGVALPAPFDTAPPAELKADAVVALDAPLDRHALETGIGLRGIRLEGLSLVWGRTRITATGDLRIGADGLPEGRIETVATNWRDLVGLAAAAGALDPAIAGTVEKMLADVGQASGAGAGGGSAQGEDRLALPLIFSGGRMSLGSLPLGPAPRFRP